MQHDKPPLTGIYAVKLSGLEPGELPGVASLGVRPTMKQDGKPTLEVHLFDFAREVYGRHVRVHFLKKIRDEQKFPDLESLKRRIAQDEQAARDYFKNEK
jgi:riboflavin kinase/FMN adenylyltransferase